MATDVQDLSARAKKLVSERNYPEAIRVCRRVLLSRPDELAVRLLLGRALVALERYDEARVEMLAFIRRAPDRASAHRLLGEAYLRGGLPDKARDALVHAIELDPDDEEAHELLREVGQDEAPSSQTIERWFDPEAVATVEMELPEFDEHREERQAATAPIQDAPPTIELDPELQALAEAAAALDAEPTRAGASSGPAEAGGGPTEPSGLPAVGSPEAAFEAISFGASPFGPPSAGGPTAPQGLPSVPSPSRPPPASKSSPPTVASPRPKRLKKSTMLGIAGLGALAPPPVRPQPIPPRSVPPAASIEATRSARPQPWAADPEATGELDLDEIMEMGPGADPLDAEPTQARGLPADDDYDPLEAEPTRARSVPASPSLEPNRARNLPGLPPYVGPSVSSGPLAGPPSVPPSAPPPASPLGFAATAGPQPSPYQSAPPPSLGAAAHPAAEPVPAPQTPVPVAQPAASSMPTSAPPGRGRPKWLWPAAIGGPIGVLLLVAMSVMLYLDHQAEEAIAAAVQTADDDGLASSLEEALRLDAEQDGDDPEDLARRARLHAVAALEHGGERAVEATALLERLDAEGRQLVDARIAETYLALAQGDLPAAERAAMGIQSGEGTSSEAIFARALAGAAAGERGRAAAEARAAVTRRPTAPRYVALFALLTADGNAAAALAALDGVPDGPRSPAVRVARARILENSGQGEQAVREATAVEDELASIASGPQRAWTHLVRAEVAAAGDRAAARAHADSAAGTGQAVDEAFGLALLTTYLALEAPEPAKLWLERMPETGPDAQARARVAAEVYLANDDLPRVEATLTAAGDSPQVAFLRGRLAQARGELDSARRAYEAAAADPSQFVRAHTRHGGLELAAGDAARAAALLAPAVARAPADLEAVPLYVDALVATDALDLATTVLTAALAEAPDAFALVLAKARVDLAAGRAAQAMSTLAALAEGHADDAALHALLGDAARVAGDPEQAHRAYTRTLELSARDVTALVGLVLVAVDAADPEAAEAALQRAERGGVSGGPLDLARARMLVLQGKGQAAVSTLRRLARGSRSAELWSALGQAYAQAERERPARRAFDRALGYDADYVDAHLGLGLVLTRSGSLGPGGRAIAAAERLVRAGALGPEYEARVLAAQARHRYEYGDFERAGELAREAVAKDERNAAAHLVLAMVAVEEGDEPTPELRLAATGRAPPPAAIGQLALRLRTTSEACDLARRYLEAAPRGYDASDLRSVAARCR